MIIYTKLFTGGNGNSRYDDLFGEEELAKLANPKTNNNNYWDDKEAYLKSTQPDQESSEEPEEHISDKAARVREALANQKMAGINVNTGSSEEHISDKAANVKGALANQKMAKINVNTKSSSLPKKIVLSPQAQERIDSLQKDEAVSRYNDLMRQRDLERDLEQKGDRRENALIAGAAAALGAAGYGAYKALKKKRELKKKNIKKD
jgi:hypothetical protein